ncbi:uncharacterized protein LOC136083208 [Hydra vulgaris]|uniref:Uncharacterized protein LOC136083208 n=1 Tax=Hydra vulgaris TaxID=6087 RepID=A0ABM4CAK0_HYDVU
MVDDIPCFIKDNRTDKSNYRPISILPGLSKVFELIIFEQIREFIEPRLNILLCGFCKGYGTQHTLLILLKNSKNACIKEILLSTCLWIFQNDLIPRDLFIGKSEACGFSHKSLKLLLSYLSDRKERVKLG